MVGTFDIENGLNREVALNLVDDLSLDLCTVTCGGSALFAELDAG